MSSSTASKPVDVLTKRAEVILKIPERPYFVAGALGGPSVVFVLTPLRNALTLASQDRTSSIRGIYSKVFARGLQGGWVGGKWPAIPACPQFIVLGPLYHFYSSILGPYAALPITGITETMITFGANARNSEIAYKSHSGMAISGLTPVWRFWGPGSIAHACRNTIAMSGMRIFSPLLTEFFGGNPTKTQKIAADFSASMFTGALSMPFNQLFNFYATSPQSHSLTSSQRFALGVQFLRNQYLKTNESGSLRLSHVMFRDIVLRSVYASCLFGIYVTIEREVVSQWSSV